MLTHHIPSTFTILLMILQLLYNHISTRVRTYVHQTFLTHSFVSVNYEFTWSKSGWTLSYIGIDTIDVWHIYHERWFRRLSCVAIIHVSGGLWLCLTLEVKQWEDNGRPTCLVSMQIGPHLRTLNRSHCPNRASYPPSPHQICDPCWFQSCAHKLPSLF